MNIEQVKNLIETKIKRKGFTIQYRKDYNGCVDWDKKTCSIPKIKGRISLYIGCHELYHCLREEFKEEEYINEFRAERFAHKYIKHLSFRMPRKESNRAKAYIAYIIRRDLKKKRYNKENINKDILHWILK